MTRQFKYLGPYDEVEVPAIPAVVRRTAIVTVEDPDVSAGLDGQSDSWESVPDPERSAAAKKAAATKADEKAADKTEKKG